MKKILIFAFMMPLIALMFQFVISAADVTDVYIHYYRYQADYTDWNIWVWQSKPVSQDGASYSFDEDDTATIFNFGGVVTKITLEGDLAEASELGFIVRKGEWAQKDIDNDRFITIPEDYTSGELHIYLVEGDLCVGYGMDDVNGPDKNPKFKLAYFNQLNRIHFVTTELLSVDNITIYKDDVEVATSDKSIDGTTGYVVLTEEIDFSKTYTIKGIFSNNFERIYTITCDGIYDSTEFEDAFGYDGDDLGAIVNGKLIYR